MSSIDYAVAVFPAVIFYWKYFVPFEQVCRSHTLQGVDWTLCGMMSELPLRSWAELVREEQCA